MTDKDTEMHFIRALSVGGLKLGHDMPSQDRRERIRVEILRQSLSDKRFGIGPDHKMETYAQAYERCYRTRLEMRLVPRLADGQPAGPNYDQVIADLSDVEDDDKEDL